MIRVYESMTEIREHALRIDGFYQGGGLDWMGGESKAQTIQRTLTGDPSLVTRAEAMLESLNTEEIETTRRIWDRAPSGAYACVPDVLAGLPTPMRRLREQGDERAPITVLASIAPSASIKADMFLKRGITILALVMALARTRPVSLWVIDYGNGNRDGTGETVMSIRVNTAPLDLASACYMLTSVAFVRRMIFGIQEKINGYTGGWPKGFNAYDQGPYNAYLVSKLSPDPARTLIIGAAHTVNEPMLQTPLIWIKDQIAKFDHVQELMTEDA